MVIIVAALLSTAAMLLKPYQDRNIAIAKMQGILSAAEIKTTAEDAISLYDKYITEELVINPEGEIISIYKGKEFEKGDKRAFDVNIKKQLHKKNQGEAFDIPLYKADINGQMLYIVPLLGKGLWGPIYGNIAFGVDFNKIVGASFGNDKETPGLGAEISQSEFGDQFIGKTIFTDDGKFTSIDIVKGGVSVLPAAARIHGVDAISGGTITCNAVADMLRNCLENYVPFVKENIDK